MATPPRIIPAPPYESFTARFGTALPEPDFISSDLGQTAIYNLLSQSQQPQRHVLIIHGVNTPALGLLALARELHRLEPSHIVLYDLWGHGLSSTPLIDHLPEIFQAQIHTVMEYLGWETADVIGYSFGGSTAVRFAVDSPGKVSSLTVLAPAGLLDVDGFSPEMKEVLDRSVEEEVTQERVLRFLEGGELVVPEGWEEKMRNGEVVPQALRRWELDEHQGFQRSLASMFLLGGAFGCEDLFGSVGGRKLAVLGEKDDVCSESQLRGMGWEDVRVVEGTGHEVPRSHPREVAQMIVRYWNES